MQVTPRPVPATHSYRARTLLGEYDMAAPEANTQVIGFRADSPAQASAVAFWLTRQPVLEVWRQDGSFHAKFPRVDFHQANSPVPTALSELNLGTGKLELLAEGAEAVAAWFKNNGDRYRIVYDGADDPGARFDHAAEAQA